MEYLNNLLKLHPFNFDSKIRSKVFFQAVLKSFNYHIENSSEFKKWCEKNTQKKLHKIDTLEDLPFLPSNIFKVLDLNSSGSHLKKLRSSGTISARKSTIYLSPENAKFQTYTLGKILTHILGEKRQPFLILDAPPSQQPKYEFSARLAGMSGYFFSSSSQTYILKRQSNQLNLNLESFINLINNLRAKNERIVIIGYTYLIYKKLLLTLLKFNKKVDCSENVTLIHFGGWKKLRDEKISKSELNSLATDRLKINQENIFDIYGFTEQLGVIYPARGQSHCRVPAYSHVIVRDTQTLKPVENGKTGFLQFISPIQISYPGLSILNDDVGRIVSSENGKQEFEVIGRPENSAPRGCGDTLPEIC